MVEIFIFSWYIIFLINGILCEGLNCLVGIVRFCLVCKYKWYVKFFFCCLKLLVCVYKVLLEVYVLILSLLFFLLVFSSLLII